MAENYRSMIDFKKEWEIIDRKDQRSESFSESELDLGVFSNSQKGKSAQDGKRQATLKGPGYRRKYVYTKSIAKYQKERLRRRRVCELSNLNQEEIAKRLGISVRTVQRDLAKIKPYHLGQFNRFCKELHEKQMLSMPTAAI